MKYNSVAKSILCIFLFAPVLWWQVKPQSDQIEVYKQVDDLPEGVRRPPFPLF